MIFVPQVEANDAFNREKYVKFISIFRLIESIFAKSQYFRTAITIYCVDIYSIFENRIVTNLYCVRSENLHQPSLFLACRKSVRKFSFEQTSEKKNEKRN